MSEGNHVHCAAVTKAGNPCRNYAIEGSAYCHVHRNYQTQPVNVAEAEDFREQRSTLLKDLDDLVKDLQAKIPQAISASSIYSPLVFLTYIRKNVSRLTPDVQLGLLQSFEDMTVEDAMDPETWKGMAYMASYSAKFRANQVKDKMNEQLPEPIQPDTMIEFVKKNVDRFTPEVVKGIMETFQGATREDLMDLETWRGMWYMINYSFTLQMNQLRGRVLGENEEIDMEEGE
jgi:hypothetical protein